MAKNQYEGYQYIDLDNFYTYKNSTVLINKQNIQDSNSAKNKNGRTQREVIRALAISKGYRAQIRVSDNDIIYNTYMDGTVYGDLQKLENLFELILEKI